MASDFDKLFGDDWNPKDRDGNSEPSEAEGPLPEQSDQTGFPPGREYTSEIENRVPRSLNEREVKVMGVFKQQEEGSPPQHFVLLRDNKTRRVPIWVGQFEAWAISLALEGEDPVRPYTHDLLKTLIEKLGGSIDRVIIDDLWNETFYAKVTVNKPEGGAIEIDARPSDAIALAVRTKAPIYMAESVLEQSVKSE